MNGKDSIHKAVHKSKSAPALKALQKSQRNGDAEDSDVDSSADSEPELSTSNAAAPDHHADMINEGVSQTALAGKYIALDCEMVGYGPPPATSSQLARVSLVNYHGHQLYDSFVLPSVPVTDYRTAITGITASSLKAMGRPFKEVQKDVGAFLSGRVLVGHALKGDLEVLMLSHPRGDIRDTSRHAGYREKSMGKTPALRNLAREVLGLEIQKGVHSSVEDARTAMLLYRHEKGVFEAEHAGKFGRRNAPNVDGELVKRKKKKKGKR
jgi:RNA exonuclease 4